MWVFKKFFTPVVPICNRTRSATCKNMVVPRTRSHMGEKAVSVRGPVFWNKLPFEAKLSKKFVTFKPLVSTQVHNLFGDHPT